MIKKTSSLVLHNMKESLSHIYIYDSFLDVIKYPIHLLLIDSGCVSNLFLLARDRCYSENIFLHSAPFLIPQTCANRITKKAFTLYWEQYVSWPT